MSVAPATAENDTNARGKAAVKQTGFEIWRNQAKLQNAVKGMFSLYLPIIYMYDVHVW